MSTENIINFNTHFKSPCSNQCTYLDMSSHEYNKPKTLYGVVLFNRIGYTSSIYTFVSSLVI